MTYLAARRWTISSSCMLTWVYGSHMVLTYSNRGRTRVKYAGCFTDMAPMLRFRLRNPMVRFALSQMFWMWVLNLRSSVTTRYLADNTLASVCPSKMYLQELGFSCSSQWAWCLYLGGTSSSTDVPSLPKWWDPLAVDLCLLGFLLPGTLWCRLQKATVTRVGWPDIIELCDLNLNSLLVKHQNASHSPGSVTGGNWN